MGNSCCTYPNGRLTLAPSLLILPALFLSFWGLFDCNFVGVNDKKDAMAIGLLWQYTDYYSSTWEFDDDVLSNITNVFNFGDDFVYSYGVCDLYSESDELMIQDDGTFTAARGFGETAVVCGCLMTIAIWIIAPCIPLPKIGWRIIGLILFMVGACQMFTLLILTSSYCSSSCTYLETGGILSILSGVLWFVSAILCCFIVGPVENDDRPLPVAAVVGTPEIERQHVVEQTTTQQHVKPDGTIVKETTTTRADGGMTVTTEVIPPGTLVASVVANKM